MARTKTGRGQFTSATGKAAGNYGGVARAVCLSASRRAAIARQAALARWARFRALRDAFARSGDS